ncbi:putative motility protein [Sporosarcina sp. YIM B06819]|uniref:putative motility protein n=1 Tax=Sporosarcina sp. YIM B06819 TaxID=3081769 RepID=UPI00298CFEEF|nr:putative motility protein [Sporosarcina sp. YIM B06819]
MDMNSIMASQLKSLQSLVQMSVMNQSLAMETSAMTEMLEVLPDQPVAHPTKGASIDVTA